MKLGIIGSGFVGSTAAYAIMLRGGASEIILIDKNKERAEAEAADIRHASPFVHHVKVYAGDYSDLEGAKMVIVTAGVAQKPGQSRLELMNQNAAILNDIMDNIIYYVPASLMLIATNPVDIMTHLATKHAEKKGISPFKVFGTGTTLDTARFRTLLGNYMGVDPAHVHGYVIGEHGDSEVLTWSIVDIGGFPVEEFAALRNKKFDDPVKQDIDDQVRHAAYKIIKGKGSTYYGVGGAISRIVDIIEHDHRAFITICTPVKEIAGVKDVTLSMPHLVSSEGVLATLPFRLNEQETEALRKSAQTIRENIDKLKID
ncbi:MAG: L-lactate dehydrogenase [Bacteroidales bacterium]|nr:L-lactate dehydrogenase [Bacteroidales bacterium]